MQYANKECLKLRIQSRVSGIFICTFGVMMRTSICLSAISALAFVATCAFAHAQSTNKDNQEATFSTKSLKPETALKAAQAVLESCRKSGAQIAVAVVDRSGITQVMLRDRFAGPHTPETAINKAWTAVTFKTNTLQLSKETEPGKEASGIRHLPRVVVVGGGVMIEANGSLVGGIGVSGAPGGVADDVCAQAGVKAIAADIEF
jgi:uncharacterized protein GlcG (DUF336 family)